MQKTTVIRPGLRWSPRPMKEYLSGWNLGPGVATLHARFRQFPDAWNLFWISAANCERPPYLTAGQCDFLSKAAVLTAEGELDGHRVGALALSLMPNDFADVVEQHAKEDCPLALYKMLGHNWLWVIRDRGQLFYNARKCEHGLNVRPPIPQGETSHSESANIVALFQKKRGRPSK